jgi:hypothetical protein
MKDQLKAMAVSYSRAAAAAVVALYMAGVTDPRTLANAFLAALIGPALKAIDPKAKEFGIGKK